MRTICKNIVCKSLLCGLLAIFCITTSAQTNGCGIGNLPSVEFASRSISLARSAMAILDAVANKMRNNPNCKITVSGYGESSKGHQQLSWDRVNTVIKYLVEKQGISEERFIFKFGLGEGDSNTVDLTDGTGEAGPETVPAPHPNLRKNK